ncbi:cold shock domain-containing protein [Kitasatospora sp. NPDC015120]|uniref:cold shock domain-containing protein n=1 Tax=Kitasatospora sp. NPDC015120 TaxID=3364023 RepID=UPI0036F47158
MAERRQGTVEWFNSEKGFGMIKPADGSASVMVKYTDVQRDLEAGLEVSYELAESSGRSVAINVEGA